ncbi:hypothetical protein FBU59_006844, partial [Linderina macrospora]
ALYQGCQVCHQLRLPDQRRGLCPPDWPYGSCGCHRYSRHVLHHRQQAVGQGPAPHSDRGQAGDPEGARGNGLLQPARRRQWPLGWPWWRLRRSRWIPWRS